MQSNYQFAKPMTPEQQYRQNVLMYVRDKIIDPIMPPVKKYDRQLKMWVKTRDYILIDKLAQRHTDELIKLVAPSPNTEQEQKK